MNGSLEIMWLAHKPSRAVRGQPAHLAQTLKAATGQTPTEFVNTLRLERAALLLSTTTTEILQIADECGFEI